MKRPGVKSPDPAGVAPGGAGADGATRARQKRPDDELRATLVVARTLAEGKA
jgi:hypothetical protein